MTNEPYYSPRGESMKENLEPTQVDLEILMSQYGFMVEAIRAYIKCSDTTKAGINKMLQILDDDKDTHRMALVTIIDALFPEE